MSRNFRMPWGNYKGEKLEDIPSDYLRWLARECYDDDIATMADELYQERSDEGSHFYSYDSDWRRK